MLVKFARIYAILGLSILVGWFAQSAYADITVSNSKPKQGQTIEITWQSSTEGKIVVDKAALTPTLVTFNGKYYKLFRSVANPEICRCLIAMPADLKPGKYPLGLGPNVIFNNSLTGKRVGRLLREQTMLTVEDGKFPVQHLTLPKTKNNFNMSPGEEQAMNAAKATLSDERLWDGKFIKPCQARISSVFGIRRIVNGKLLKDYYHSGVDFAGNMGQPVTACADGKVVLAHPNFKLHGNVIALDHGQGVVTIYIHLQKIMVKEGELVKAGQQIGAVGATGRANGPHLHLSLYINQVAANPLPWFTQAF